tara:strand:- start:43 stop:312 length:270 start_codon:yes stop_codon:yes gene_type:complete
MNEQIKELMKQAGTDSSGKWMGVEHAEKFAELIVQECLDTIQRGIDNFGSHDPKIVDGGQYALFYTYRNIQSRFGMGPYQDQEHLGVEE